MGVDVLIVDGRHALYRSADQLRDLSHDGEQTGAIYGFLNTIAMVHRQWGGLVIVCWEGVGQNWRRAIFPAYKRRAKPPTEEDIEFFESMNAQQKILMGILSKAGIRQFSGVECEADDVIGTLVHGLKRRGREILIFSGDSDLRQLVDEGVTVLAPGHRTGIAPTRYDVQKVKEKHGVEPHLIPDLKGLAGDSSDGIPGLPGIGPKTALALVSAYGSAEGVVKAAQAGGGAWPVAARFQSLVAAEAENVALYKRLATIRTDVELKAIAPKADRAGLIGEFKALGFRAFLAPNFLYALANMAKGA